MIASAQTIRRIQPITPFNPRTEVVIDGKKFTFGLGPAGYDIRVDGTYHLKPQDFVLAASLERFHMPLNWLGIVHDKSSWARRGITVQNTVIEPGWSGYLTLEITNHSDRDVEIPFECGIAQVIFHILDETTDSPYTGKYQNQEMGPQKAR